MRSLAAVVVFVVLVVARCRDQERRRALEPLLVTAATFPFLATVPRLAGITDDDIDSLFT